MHLKLTILLLSILLSATSATSPPPSDPQTTHHHHLHARLHRRHLGPDPTASLHNPPPAPASHPPAAPLRPRTLPNPFPDMLAHLPSDFWEHATHATPPAASTPFAQQNRKIAKHRRLHAPRRFPVFLDKPEWGAAALSPGGAAGASLTPPSGNPSTASAQAPSCICVQDGAISRSGSAATTSGRTNAPTTPPPSSLAIPTPPTLPKRHAEPLRPYEPHNTPPKPFPDMLAHLPADFWAHATPAAETETARRHPHAPRRFPVFLEKPDWGAALSTVSSAAAAAGSQAASGNASAVPSGAPDCICSLPGAMLRSTTAAITTATSGFRIASTAVTPPLTALAFSTPTTALTTPPLLSKRQTEEHMPTPALRIGTTTIALAGDDQDTYTRCAVVPAAGASSDGNGVVACQTFVAKKGGAAKVGGGKGEGGAMAVVAGGVALGAGLLL